MKTRKTKLLMISVTLIIIFALSACNSNSIPAENLSSPSPTTSETAALTTAPDDEPDVLPMVEGRSLTLDDVRALADYPYGFITMKDLSEYTVDLLDDGLYGYRVIGGADPYNLVVASADGYIITSTKFYNALVGGILGDTSEFIDIRYYDVDKFITDGVYELVRPLPAPDDSEAPNIIGTWKAETGGITHFYQDGTGETEGSEGEYGFTWRITSFAVAAKQPREYRIFEYIRILSDSATSLDIPWGADIENEIGPDGIIGKGYILSLVFDDITYDITFDFAFVLEGENILKVNTGHLGQRLSPETVISERFEWVTFRRED